MIYFSESQKQLTLQRKEELDMLSKGYYRVFMLVLALMSTVGVLADDFETIGERLALQRYNFPQG